MLLRPLLALLLSSWLFAACGGCSGDPPPLSSASREGSPSHPAQVPEAFQALAGSPPPPPDRYEPTLQDYEANGIPLTATEFGPFDGRIFLAAGKPDFENRHTSTVMISTLGPLEAAQCSGILLAPDLVLTAASCVCRPRQVASHEGTTTLFDSADCSPTAYATTIVYGNRWY